MPLFDFHCDDCNDDFEELLPSASAAKDLECPNCGSDKVNRLLSGFALPSGGGLATAGSSSSSSCGSGPFR